MAEVKVKYLKSWHGFEKGDVSKVSPELAKVLNTAGIAQSAAAKKKTAKKK